MKKSIVFMGLLSAAFTAAPKAYAGNYTAQTAPEQSKYNRPEDLLSFIPFLGSIPSTFLVGDGYKMKVSGKSLRVDHMGWRSHSSGSEQRNCIVGFRYSTPVAGFFTTQIDLPVFHSATPAFSDWSANTMGDYVANFSKGVGEPAGLRLMASLRF